MLYHVEVGKDFFSLAIQAPLSPSYFVISMSCSLQIKDIIKRASEFCPISISSGKLKGVFFFSGHVVEENMEGERRRGGFQT